MPAEGNCRKVNTLPGGGCFFMQDQNVFIFANGEIIDLKRARALINKGDFIIAADGGSQYLQKMGMFPDVLIGDLDSTSPEFIELIKKAGKEIHQYPTAKDATDLEIAIQYAIALQPEKIIIVGGLGGRVDHLLANVMLLQRYQNENPVISMDDGMVEMQLVMGKLAINGAAGDIVSLIPLSDQVIGIVTENLGFPLRNETIVMGESRGISNVMLMDVANVSIISGVLLCVHTRTGKGEENES
jgi:thiamine pyrophosphokinase